MHSSQTSWIAISKMVNTVIRRHVLNTSRTHFFIIQMNYARKSLSAGFVLTGVYGLEGPAWLVSDFDEWWANPAYRERLLNIARVLETEPSMLGVSAHIMAVARKSF